MATFAEADTVFRALGAAGVELARTEPALIAALRARCTWRGRLVWRLRRLWAILPREAGEG